MIDPVTGWFEMEAINDKTVANVSYVSELTWFARYPLPHKIIFNRGTEIMA